MEDRPEPERPDYEPPTVLDLGDLESLTAAKQFGAKESVGQPDVGRLGHPAHHPCPSSSTRIHTVPCQTCQGNASDTAFELRVCQESGRGRRSMRRGGISGGRAPRVLSRSKKRFGGASPTTGCLSVGLTKPSTPSLLMPTPSVVVIRGPIDDRQAALSFLLAVLPLALPLFDLEPLHGAAVGLRQGGALLLLGPSGAGKSTTAAAFLARDCPFLADDVCALDPDGVLWPGPPLLATDRGDGRHFATYYDKSIWIPDSSQHEPTSVCATILLEPSPNAELSLTPLDARSAFTGILRHARSRRLLASLRQRTQFLVAATLARRPVLALAYDHGTHGPALLADTVIDRLGAIPMMAES